MNGHNGMGIMAAMMVGMQAIARKEAIDPDSLTPEEIEAIEAREAASAARREREARLRAEYKALQLDAPLSAKAQAELWERQREKQQAKSKATAQRRRMGGGRP